MACGGEYQFAFGIEIQACVSSAKLNDEDSRLHLPLSPAELVAVRPEGA